jgi:hypothetical protein
MSLCLYLCASVGAQNSVAVAEAELILRCKTTNGVVERSVKHDAEQVYVSRTSLSLTLTTHTSP